MLANCVFTFHLGIVLFMLLAPFVCNAPYILLVHVSFAVCILVHWIGNNNMCSLSVLEAQLRGIRYDEGFMHKFIAPVYDLSQSNWILLCYIVTVILTCIATYKLVYNDRWAEISDCYNQMQGEGKDRVSTLLVCIEKFMAL